MRARLSTVWVVCLTVLCLGCGSGDSGVKKGRAGAKPEASFVDGLVAQAKELWASQREKLAEGGKDASEPSARPADPIVRCNVNGTIEFTNESRCQNRGGRGYRMALKAKNDR